MLSESVVEAIRSWAGHYPTSRAAVPEALRIVQREQGWVSDASVRDIARLLGVSPDDVESVATFYSGIYRKPVGRHVISVCDSVSCWVMGCEAVMERLRATLGIRPGETTSDGRFTLLPAGCLGACDHAPALMVDGDLHEEQTPSGVDRVLERYP